MSKIVCKWRTNNNRYMVNPNGQVFQCCYLKKNFHKPDNEDYFIKGNHPWVDEYLDNEDDYNLDNRNLKDILDSDLFKKKLPDTCKNPDTAPYPCQRYCKVKT